MKKSLIITAALAIFLAFAAFSQGEQPIQQPVTEEVNPNAPVATFDKLEFNFGEIEQGIPKTAEFNLTNDGKEPLLISNARASCGCTNLKYSQEPIMPKKSIPISVTYNAAAPGGFTKTITVTTNANPQPVVLRVTGTVIPKPPVPPTEPTTPPPPPVQEPPK
jgi:hypothetical protein